MIDSLFCVGATSLSHGIDVVTTLILVLALVIGATRGLSNEFARLFAFAVGIAAAVIAFPYIKAYIAKGDAATWQLIAMAISVVLAVVVGKLVHVLTKRFLKLLLVQPVDAILGAAASTLTTGAVILVILFFLYHCPVWQDTIRTRVFGDSVVGQTAEQIFNHMGIAKQ